MPTLSARWPSLVARVQEYREPKCNPRMFFKALLVMGLLLVHQQKQSACLSPESGWADNTKGPRHKEVETD